MPCHSWLHGRLDEQVLGDRRNSPFMVRAGLLPDDFQPCGREGFRGFRSSSELSLTRDFLSDGSRTRRFSVVGRHTGVYLEGILRVLPALGRFGLDDVSAVTESGKA